ncbi:MAG: site-specific integrase [Candidatus Marinimicrobia bacterium]|nr:site-specific integrase [Candidatus Neomarinimicrobiota bacterium]
MAGIVRYPGGAKNKGNRNRSGKFYCRIYISANGQAGRSKLIPLRTEDPKIAAIRLEEIERVEMSIKAGVEFQFSWLSGKPTELVRMTVRQAADDYLKARALEGIRPKTLEVYSLALQHFISVAGVRSPIDSIDGNTIDRFKHAFLGRHSTTTLNMNLRSLKTFLTWSVEKGLMPKVPTIKQIRQGRSLPKYISDPEFDLIQEEATPFLADVFWFYRETGCRLREPFRALLKGMHLIVAPEDAKASEERQIPLNPDLVRIYEQIMASNHRPEYYTKAFKKITRKLGLTGHRFHDLRHTFGVRTWLQTGDIMLVSNLMGHRNLETTMIYTRFLPSRLAEDFPDLTAYVSEHSKGRAERLGIG